MHATGMTSFRVEIPQADLDDLRDRLTRTRLPDEMPGVDGSQGVGLDYMKELIAYWLDGFDWRAEEAKLNAHPQFTATIDGQTIHFLHVRSPEPDATAVIATHGWPMSVFEYVDLIGPLTDPRAHGGDPANAVDLVIPSLPGFGFSRPGPTELGWNAQRVARAWATLMAELGYDRYVAMGNDAGSIVSPEVGRVDPQRCVGVHVTQLFSFPSGDPDELAGLSADDMAKLEFLQAFNEQASAFAQLQSTQPQTLAYALHDSPAGQLAWSGQLFGTAVDRDYILANAALYWLTGTAASAARFYWENQRAEPAGAPTSTATAVAVFAYDFRTIRPLAERDHAGIVQWTEYDRGSHFAAQDAPDLLVADVQRFIASLR